MTVIERKEKAEQEKERAKEIEYNEIFIAKGYFGYLEPLLTLYLNYRVQRYRTIGFIQ